MSAPALPALVAAIVEALGALPGVADAARTGGRFDEAALRKWAVLAPAVRVAVLGLGAVTQVDTGECDAEASIGAFLVTRDAQGLDRDSAALDLVERVITAAQLGRWGRLRVHPARALSAESLYSGSLQSTGVTIWAVIWRQKVRLGASDYPVFAGHIEGIEADERVSEGEIVL